MKPFITVCAVSVGLLGLGTGTADASTIRNGTATTLPTSTSPVTAAGTTVGSGTLVGQATLTGPTNAFCSQGRLTGTLGTNPSASIALGSPALSISACMDDNPNYDFPSISLAGSGAVTVQSTGAAGGTITIPNPTFRALIQLPGTITSCTLALVTPGNVVGSFVNGTATSGSNVPRIVLNNVRVRSTATSGFCPGIFGSGSPSSNSTVINHTFGPLRVGAVSNGFFLGLFP